MQPFPRLFAIACAILPCCAAANPDAALRAAVDAAVRPVMAQYDIPGMAVGVTVDGQCAFFHYGVASREQQAPVGADTIFELGSISKTFTATLAAYAAEQGALSLDDHPGKYLPQLAGLSDKDIHAPWNASPVELEAAGVELGGNYPLPVVDHAEAREKTLARYSVVKKA